MTDLRLPPPPGWRAPDRVATPATGPSSPGVEPGWPGSERTGSAGGPTGSPADRPRCAAKAAYKTFRGGRYPTAEDQGCSHSAVVGDPEGLCQRHRSQFDGGATLHLVDGRTLPERLSGAEIVQFPTPPGMEPAGSGATVVAAADVPTVLGQAVAQGLTRCLEIINDPGSGDHKVMKATEIVCRFALKSGLLRSVEEAEASRNLDDELGELIEAVLRDNGAEVPERESERAQLLRLADKFGYEIEDDEQEAG